ncbi:putative polysaccharide biosynthesis protein [Staphylospora marina]|uniref:putative polysaccharide biosynthesis protein n=1 Tax=Staphylospora marina TaxID=2490858 RepID=UPI0013DE55C3|nr:polysaccharide biosynthesis protein [Staphylospora marina]
MAEARQSFVRGAAILGFALLISKFLGAAYRIPYQNITGNEGMYVYQQVYSLYSVLLTLATAGFPLAISKMVSEKLASGDSAGAREVFRVSAATLSLAGCLLFVLLFFGAESIAEWMGNREALTLPIRAVAPALLVVPLVSAARGYFQGTQNMMPTAVSQVTEQTFRVATILILSWYFMEIGWGTVYAGAGAMFGSFVGAVAGLAVFAVFRSSAGKGVKRRISPFTGNGNSGRLVRDLLALSLPVCLGSLVIPLFSLVDSFTVANLLVAGGMDLSWAVNEKGIYDRAQPLIQFGSFFATAIALSVVPAIAEARTEGKHREAEKRAALSVRLTWLFGLPASLGLFLIAEPANVMLFEDAAGTDALALMSFTILFSTLLITTSGVLQGYGRVIVPAVSLLTGAGIKWVLNVFLIPGLGIRGAALATVAGYLVAVVINLAVLVPLAPALRRETDGLWRSLIAVFWMSAAVFGVCMGVQAVLPAGLADRAAMSVIALTGLVTGACVYGWALLRFGALRMDEIETLPKIGKRIRALGEKKRWFRA